MLCYHPPGEGTFRGCQPTGRHLKPPLYTGFWQDPAQEGCKKASKLWLPRGVPSSHTDFLCLLLPSCSSSVFPDIPWITPTFHRGTLSTKHLSTWNHVSAIVFLTSPRYPRTAFLERSLNCVCQHMLLGSCHLNQVFRYLIDMLTSCWKSFNESSKIDSQLLGGAYWKDTRRSGAWPWHFLPALC